MNIKYFTLLIFLICFSTITKAQFFTSGQEPANIKWNSLQSEHFRVLYSHDYNLQAHYFSSILEKNYSFFQEEFNIKPHFTIVVLHNRTALSNGFSVLSPLRMEIGAVAPQTIYSQLWLDQLAIHEFRHSIQIQSFRKGFARHFYWLLGDASTSAAMALLPFWFIEGEAVWTETNYSRTGRGRDAEFVMQMHALAKENINFSVSKILLGSYKNFVPNYYNTGYHLYDYGKKMYGDSLWTKVIQRMSKKPYRPFPFTSGIKKYTGISFKKFCTAAVKDIAAKAKQDSSFVSYTPLNRITDDFADYSFVFPFIKDNYIAIKKSFDDIISIVQINKDGKERLIHYPGYVFDGRISYANNKIAWSGLAYNKRWEQKNGAVIKIFDMITGKVRTVTSKNKKYLSPSLSPDGNYIAAVKTDDAIVYYLTILSADDGHELYSKKFDWNEFVITPQWDKKGKRVVYVKLSDKGKQIDVLEISTKKITTLRKAEYHNIKYPCLDGEKLFFIAPYDGKNNLYVSSLSTNKLFKVTDAKYGINYPFIYDDKVCFSDYSAKGYNATTLSLDTTTWTKIDNKNIGQPFGIPTFRAERLENYSVKKNSNIIDGHYSKLKNMVNFHSLTPFAMHNDLSFEEHPGISVHSQNMLSSMFISGGYFYNRNLKGNNYYLDILHKAYYPVFKLNTKYENGVYDAVKGYDYTDVSFDNLSTSLSIKTPINISSENYSRNITPEIVLTYHNLKLNSDKGTCFYDKKMLITSMKLLLYNLRHKSKRDIYPKYGQILEFNFFKGREMKSKFNHDLNTGSMFSGEGIFYFPGMMVNHSLWYYTAYQTSNNLIGLNNISYPRGVGHFICDEAISVKVNYSLPILYPDWELGGIAYFKRLSATLFYDHMSYWHNERGNIETTGIEVMGEINFFRHIIPASFGVRNTYKINSQEYYPEIMLNFNLNY